MKRIVKLILGIVLFTGLWACSKENDEKTELTLSATELIFDKSADEKNVSVQTNANEFRLVVPKNTWFTVEKIGSELIRVKVSENNQPEKRDSEFVIIAGDVVKNVKVIQNNGNTHFELSTTEVEIIAAGESINIDVDSNIDDYTVNPQESWISVTLFKKKGFFTLTVEKNSDDARQGTIKINNAKGEELATITVKQKSVGFVMPFLEFGKFDTDIKNFEYDREQTEYAEEKDIAGSGTLLKYTIQDLVFSEIHYLLNTKGLEKIGLYVAGGTISPEKREKFEAFLLDEGYEKITEKGYKTSIDYAQVDKVKFVNKKLQTKVEFMEDARANHYSFTYYPYQNRDYATFAKFPFFEKGATQAQVENYETQNGGTYESASTKTKLNYKNSKKTFDIDRLFFSNKASSILGRQYFLYVPGQTRQGLFQVIYYYADFQQALFLGLDGEYYPTREFIELAKANGFEYVGKTSAGSQRFKNSTLNVSLYAKYARDSEFGYVLQISIY